jgi:hypothetical protein
MGGGGIDGGDLFSKSFFQYLISLEPKTFGFVF